MALDYEYALVTSVIIFIGLFVFLTSQIGFNAHVDEVPDVEDMSSFTKTWEGIKYFTQDAYNEHPFLGFFYSLFVASPIILVFSMIITNYARGRG